MTTTGSGSLGDPYRADPQTPVTGATSVGTSGTDTDSGATGKAKATAGTAKDEGKHVAGVAKDEAASVAGEAKDKARDLAGELRTQVQDQSRTQKDNLASLLRQLGDELEEMAGASSSSGLASDLARKAAGRSRDASDFMSNREPGDLVDEVRRFASRRSGTFLLGALVAGVAAGRLTRGAATAHGVGQDDSSSSTGTYREQYADTTVVPPVETSRTEGYGGRVPTGPAVDPVEPGYGTLPPTTRPGGVAP